MGFFSQTLTLRTPSTGTARPPTFTELYAEHFDGLVAAVQFFGVPARDAGDVAQDAFVRIAAALPRFDSARPVGPWLKTIAYRTARDYLRSAHVRRSRLDPSDEAPQLADTAPTPERLRLMREMQRVLVEVLLEINEDQRTVYLLNVIDDTPIAEIAASLVVPENTVRSRLHRAHAAVEAGVARRRTVEEQRSSAMVPLLVPAALADAARKGLAVDAAVKTAVWGHLSRLLGLGIIGALAPLPGAAIVGGAALLFALGGGAGALLHAGLARPPSPETTARAEPAAPASAPTSPGAPPSARASPTSTTTTTVVPITSASASGAEPDAGASDPAAVLRAEQALLARARSAMDSERYETALRELNRHERIYPNGKLAQQRKEMKRVAIAELSAHDAGR